MKKHLYTLLISLAVNAYFVFDYLLDNIDGENPVATGKAVGISILLIIVILVFINRIADAIKKYDSK